MSISLRYSSLQALSQAYDPEMVEKAFQAALSRTTSKAATLISKDVRKVFAVKAGDIRGALQIKRARRDRHRVLLYAGGHLPMEKFKPSSRIIKTTINNHPVNGSYRARRQRVTARVRKDKGRQVLKGAWIAKGQVMRRSDQADNKSDPWVQYGPAIAQMVDNPKLLDRVQDFVREDLPNQFINRMENEIWKAANR
ncbi:phage tail protein [Oceanospirillum maris]|uniref:phage tail protein n=1 Tax=Oceanospirillum maris TaxID=64977 RepID=UPI0004256944|nr:phage tail protein [Oceanospirillum maris]